MRSPSCDGIAPSISSAATSRRETSSDPDDGDYPPDPCNFAVLARAVWHVKAPAAIHAYTARSERTCRDWTSDRSEPPASIAFALIRSPEGYRVLTALMRTDPPAWWRNLQIELELAKLAREIFERVGVVTCAATSSTSTAR